MALSDLILLIIVIAFFAKKIWEKKKGKNGKNISGDIKHESVSRRVDVWKHVINYDVDFIAEELETFINKTLQHYSDQDTGFDVEYKFNNNVFYMIIVY